MVQRFRKFITGNSLLKQDDRILLAVSGGIDSMVMTHLFLRSGYKAGIAHCNFSLRAEESDKDEEMVAKFAAENNIEFNSIRFDTKAYANKTGISLQMAARDLRYEWFERIRVSNGYDYIAVAHNLNDSIETVLINLIRGTGISGLTGIKPASNRIIRPLLFATRHEIEDYCKNNSIIFREDKSNADTKYLRNKIRHQVIPMLRDINPSIEPALNQTAEILEGINEVFTDYTDQLRKKVSERKDDYTSFNVSLLKQHIHNKAVLFELLKPYGISELSLNDLVNVINGKTGKQLLTRTHRLIRNREELIVMERRADQGRTIVINFPGDFEKVEQIESVMALKITGELNFSACPSEMYIDSDKLSYPILLRTWTPGDCFYPLGSNHRKKLSDYFTDNKYSLPEKDKAVLMESAGEIVCILGERLDNRFRITEDTRNALVIRTKPKS